MNLITCCCVVGTGALCVCTGWWFMFSCAVQVGAAYRVFNFGCGVGWAPSSAQLKRMMWYVPPLGVWTVWMCVCLGGVNRMMWYVQLLGGGCGEGGAAGVFSYHWATLPLQEMRRYEGDKGESVCRYWDLCCAESFIGGLYRESNTRVLGRGWGHWVTST